MPMEDENSAFEIGYSSSMIWALAFAVAALSCCSAWGTHETTERYKACIEKFDHEKCGTD